MAVEEQVYPPGLQITVSKTTPDLRQGRPEGLNKVHWSGSEGLQNAVRRLHKALTRAPQYSRFIQGNLPAKKDKRTMAQGRVGGKGSLIAHRHELSLRE